MVQIADEKQPFVLEVNVRTLPKKGQHVVYSAPEDVRAKIAETYDLISVENFEAKGQLSPWKRDGVHLTGQVKADITQPCAVTSQPLEAKLDEKVDIIFVPDGSRLAKPPMNDDGEWVFDADGGDLPETFIGDSIDVAQIWLEFFAMGIDPYARR